MHQWEPVIFDNRTAEQIRFPLGEEEWTKVMRKSRKGAEVGVHIVDDLSMT